MKIRVDGGYINYNPSTDNGEYCYYIQDHIGNNRVILSETRGVIQYADYYPYGIPFSEIPMEEDNFLHAGKELEKMHGLYWYDNGKRWYDPILCRFTTMDPLCEKYYDKNPYSYCADNPMRYGDVNGDSISVTQEYRGKLNSTLSSVFGDYSIGFSYSDTGMLTFSGSTKGMTKDQKTVLKGLNKVMNESVVTNIVYGENAEIMDTAGNTITLDASKGGGAVAVLASENSTLKQNTILINPSINTHATVYAVTPAYYVTPIIPDNGPRFIKETISQGVNDVTFHEIGHVIYQGKAQNNVINYHNRVRRILNLAPRPYDETHNRNVKRGVY